LIYSPKADIPVFLNMPNTPKAEILASPHGMYIGWGAQGYLDISMGT